MAAVKANPATTPISIAGLPDPDVDSVEVEVRVRHPLHDGTGATYQTLYHATRTLNPVTGAAPLGTDPGTTVPVAYIDAPTIEGWAAQQATVAPSSSQRPRRADQDPGRAAGRQHQLLRPRGYADHGHHHRRAGQPAGEPALLERPDALEPVAGYLFRRPPDVAAPGLVQQLGELLGVASNGNSADQPARTADRVRSIQGPTPHHLGGRRDPDLRVDDRPARPVGRGHHPRPRAGLDLGRATGRRLHRAAGRTDRHRGDQPAPVGAITVPRVIGAAANTNPTEAARSRTRFIFLNAIDPHEPVPDSGFPESLQHRWFVNPVLRPAGPPLQPRPLPHPLLGPSPLPPVTGTELASTPLDLRLPIAIPPVTGAGHRFGRPSPIALRRRPRLRCPRATPAGPVDRADPADRQHAWAMRYSPGCWPTGPTPCRRRDPGIRGTDQRSPVASGSRTGPFRHPGRHRRPGRHQRHDPAIPSSTSPVHFLLPLPPGSDADDPELFGFYSYELRVGHAGPIGDLRWWSTANGRFGSPLRVVGVQHPAPPLACHAGRYTYPPTVSTSNLITQRRASTVPFPSEVIIVASGTERRPGRFVGSGSAASAARRRPPLRGGGAAVASSAAGGATAADLGRGGSAPGIRVISTATTARPPLTAAVPLTSSAAIAATPIRGIGGFTPPAPPAPRRPPRRPNRGDLGLAVAPASTRARWPASRSSRRSPASSWSPPRTPRRSATDVRW